MSEQLSDANEISPLQLMEEHNRNYPRMPDEFWPDEILLVSKHKSYELGVCIKSDAELQTALLGLRRAMWNAANWKRDCA